MNYGRCTLAQGGIIHGFIVQLKLPILRYFSFYVKVYGLMDITFTLELIIGENRILKDQQYGRSQDKESHYSIRRSTFHSYGHSEQ